MQLTRKDIPLLNLIRGATFVTASQLVALGMHYGLERYRQTIRWRLSSFLATGAVTAHPPLPQYRGPIYSLSAAGFSTLESLSASLLSIASDSTNLADPIQAAHFLDINELRLAVLKHTPISLSSWLTDRQLASINLSSTVPFAKDYDAVVTLPPAIDGGRPVVMALEYERTYKAKERYELIAHQLATESKVDFVLYVTSSAELIEKLLPLVTPTATSASHIPVAVVATDSFQFREHSLDCKVVYLEKSSFKGAKLSDLIRHYSRKLPTT